MLERFLVPLDTSDASKFILPYVAFLAKRLHQPVHLVTVITDAVELRALGQRHDSSISELIERRRSAAQQELDTVRAHFVEQGITTTSEVSTGPVAERILEAADIFGAGLIAMATHGRVGPERWFLGSVTDRVVRASSIPVLVVRPPHDEQSAAPSIDQVILPLDGSHLAEDALPYATFLAQSLRASLTLVRTVDLTTIMGSGDPYSLDGGISPDLLDLLESDAKGYLEAMASRVKEGGLEVRQAYALGPPAGEIIDLAQATRRALIVMSTHGRSGLGRTVLGSVTDRVIRSSEAPVLVVRVADSTTDDAQ